MNCTLPSGSPASARIPSLKLSRPVEPFSSYHRQKGGMVRRLRLGMLVAAIAIGSAGPAWADATAFLGANTTPANRQVRGFSIGAGLALVAFEFEYARTSDYPLAAAPA